ncbi:MAG: FAD-dependent oxidoreductase [Candidatus Thorarchaeota archaeon]|nr:FAD-dependent oxidoreductase [Candidatus Thorarchaeota archaeon]
MRLMESEHIGRLELENRLVMTATHLGYCQDGLIPRKMIDFYAERAKYRPGLIIVGGCYTEHLGMSTPHMIGISEDRHLDGLKELVTTIHGLGVPVAAQLYHAGRYAHSLVLGEQAVSASPVPCRLTHETPRALTGDEVRRTIANFGAAAARAKTAGFDAVEILGSAGYLINQFLAEATNKRTDEYGGDFKRRTRFALEVVSSVRKAVGRSYPVMYRMSGEDFVEGGLTLEDNKTLAPMLEGQGVDAIDVTGGWHETRVPQITMDVPRGHYAYLAEGIAESVSIPVVACNRINSLGVAERILSREKVRLIGMSRGLIADPEFPEKIRSGRVDEVRPCIGCNQGCLDRVFTLGPVTCAVNACAGYESSRALRTPGSGNIAVVGSGPAGLEVSRVLRLRGFDVSLFESKRSLGGLLRLAARVPGRGEFAAYLSHMEREIRRLGVQVHLGREVTYHTVSDYDFVVCATGTVPEAPPVEGAESPNVTTAYDVLAGPSVRVGKAVVLGGNAIGCYASLFLSTCADEVELVEKGRVIGEGLGRTTRWVILQAMRNRGVEVLSEAEVSQVTSEYVVVTKDEDFQVISCDVVVLSAGAVPHNRLFNQLDERGIPCALVGSANHSAGLLECVHSAYDFANRFNVP